MLESRYRPWTSRRASIHFNPSYWNKIIILTSAFISCSTHQGIFQSHPRTQLVSHSFFFFHLGGAMGKAYWSSSDYKREIIFLLWKQKKPLTPKPPPWGVRKEVGHKEHKEPLCFAPVLGNQQVQSNPSGWSMSLGSGFSTWKETRARGWGCTPVSGLDYLVPQPFLLSDLYPGVILDSDAIALIEQYQSDI